MRFWWLANDRVSVDKAQNVQAQEQGQVTGAIYRQLPYMVVRECYITTPYFHTRAKSTSGGAGLAGEAVYVPVPGRFAACIIFLRT
jgi:hypothetical protein